MVLESCFMIHSIPLCNNKLMRRDQWQSYLGLPRRLDLTQDMGLLLNAGGKARDPLDHNAPVAQPTGTPGPVPNRIPVTADAKVSKIVEFELTHLAAKALFTRISWRSLRNFVEGGTSERDPRDERKGPRDPGCEAHEVVLLVDFHSVGVQLDPHPRPDEAGGNGISKAGCLDGAPLANPGQVVDVSRQWSWRQGSEWQWRRSIGPLGW